MSQSAGGGEKREIRCPRCQARYRIPVVSKTLRVSCDACKNVWEETPHPRAHLRPEFTRHQAPPPPPPPPPPSSTAPRGPAGPATAAPTTNPYELSAADKARIEAEEKHRAKIRAQLTPGYIPPTTTYIHTGSPTTRLRESIDNFWWWVGKIFIACLLCFSGLILYYASGGKP